ncbi:MAG TPA: triose-phosphate isomerase [Acidobacteriota bacterium]|nr:triose-phosphate isomerase [Acidobacteriota bacterium]
MRDKFIAGNWKMNTTREETAALIGELIRTTASIRRTTIMVAPPFTNLATAAEALVNTQIKLGAQNMCWEDKGPFTGEVSGPMLRDVGCQYVIIGHSERRHVFGETDADVNRKVRAALRNGLLPIICVGETLKQREAGRTLKVVDGQIRKGLDGFDVTQATAFTIAYEPVWAIGTGHAATPAHAVEVHARIRHVLGKMFGGPVASQSIRILYGGSVTAENIEALMREPEIDGALVGGASLKADSFTKIVEAAEKS